MESRNILVVIDMQNDFIDGALGSADAQAIVDNVVSRIRDFDGEVVATRDTHPQDYLTATLEGARLPVLHCVAGSQGWEICPKVAEALEAKGARILDKRTFGTFALPALLTAIPGFGKDSVITVLGLDTDICVVCGAMILRASFPDNVIEVDASCCAGTCPQRHAAALDTMRSCQIDVVGE